MLSPHSEIIRASSASIAALLRQVDVCRDLLRVGDQSAVRACNSQPRSPRASGGTSGSQCGRSRRIRRTYVWQPSSRQRSSFAPTPWHLFKSPPLVYGSSSSPSPPRNLMSIYPKLQTILTIPNIETLHTLLWTLGDMSAPFPQTCRGTVGVRQALAQPEKLYHGLRHARTGH